MRLLPLPLKPMLPLGTSEVFDELAVRVKLLADVSASLTVTVNGPAAPLALMTWLPTEEMDGAVLPEVTGVTVTVKLMFAVSAPSLTVSVIVVLPD